MLYELLFGILSGALGSAFLVASGLFLSRVIKSIFKSPAKISGMRTGEAVELLGGIVPDKDAVEAMHSGKKCVWLEEATEKEMKKEGADKTKWEIEKVHRKTVPFSITDGTGKIPVEVSNAEIQPRREFFKKGIDHRIEESRIDVGDRVFVAGIVEMDDGGKIHLHLTNLAVGSRLDYLRRPLLLSSMFLIPGILLILVGAIFITKGI